MTAYEQLPDLHGRVHFRLYISCKPGKFGIKIYCLTESLSCYCPVGFIYIRTDSISANAVEESSSITYAT